eukprot:3940302-Rhodomonas_salina.5
MALPGAHSSGTPLGVDCAGHRCGITDPKISLQSLCGTELACGAISLCACYVMSGTELVCAAARS